LRRSTNVPRKKQQTSTSKVDELRRRIHELYAASEQPDPDKLQRLHNDLTKAMEERHD